MLNYMSSLYILDTNPLLDIIYIFAFLIFIVNTYSLEPYWNNALRSVFKMHSSKEVYFIKYLVAHQSGWARYNFCL